MMLTRRMARPQVVECIIPKTFQEAPQETRIITTFIEFG
jgi:hypothetical protein